MTRRARFATAATLASALAALTGCGATPQPASDSGAPRGTPIAPPAGPSTRSAVAGRVWASADSTAAPGSLRIFLADGTLLMDSCFETYRLTAWHFESDTAVVWNEDGRDVRAAILAASDTELVLRLDLSDGPRLERWRVATVPFTCPDLPR